MALDHRTETTPASDGAGPSPARGPAAGNALTGLRTKLRSAIGGIGLRPRLLLLVSLAVVPLTALVGYLLWLEHDETLRRAESSLREAAELAASSQSGMFEEAHATLEALRAVPQMRMSGGFTECSAIAASLQEGNPNFNAIGAFDADGMITCHSRLTKSRAFGDRELFERAKTSDASEFLVGNFTIGRSSGKPTVITLKPLFTQDGAFAGAVFASINLERLSATGKAMSDDGRRTLVTMEPISGRMLTRYPPFPIPYGTAFPDHALVQAMRDAPMGGVVEAPGLDGLDGIDRIFGFAPLRGVEKSGMMLAVSEPREALLASVRLHLVLSLSFLGAVLLFASTGMWWLGYWTHLRPIHRLRTTAEQIGTGDHEARASLEAWQAPELRLFGRRLEEMAEKLAEGRSAERAMAESHRYLKIAERLAEVGYWQYDPRSGRSTWSDEVFRIHDMPIGAEPPPFDDCIAVCHEDDRQIVKSSFARAIADGIEFEIQIRIVRGSGEVRFVLSRACVERNEAGAVSLVYGAILDITDIKKAERETQAANVMLRMAEDVSEVGHWRLDLRSGALTWSAQVYRIHGHDPGTYNPLLETAIDAYHPEDRNEVSDIVAAAIRQKRPYEFQKRVLRPDGTVRDVVSRGRCEIDPASGEVAAIFGVIMDVTVAKTAERELKAKSARLEAILDTMDQGLVMIGTDRRLDVGNGRFAELLDLPADFLRDPRPDFDDIIAFLDDRGEFADSDPAFRRQMQIRGAAFTLGIYERRRPNGRILEVRTVPLSDGGGIVRTYTDVTERRAAESGLKESEMRYRMLVENASDMIFRLDRDLVRTYVSPASFEILGYAPDELVGKRPANMIHPDDADGVAGVYAEILAGHERADITNRIRHKSGRWVWVEVELRALRDPVTNEVVAILGALRDVSERKRAEERIAESETRFRMLAENTADLVTHVDATGRRTFASPAARDLLGYAPDELIGGRPIDLAYPDDRPALGAMLDRLADGDQADSVQYRALRKDGAYRWIEATGRPLGPEKGYILALRDIDRRKQAEDELEMAVLRLHALANSDGLTGLANRRRFDDTLAKELARAARSRSPISLILADVDHFKAYNDTYGHPAGDACLRKVADILSGVIRGPGDLAARYGGEEFAAVLPETDESGAFALSEMFRKAVAGSGLEHSGSSTGRLTISVGIATIVPTPGITVSSDLIEDADGALYAAKGSGRNCVRQFERPKLALAQAG